MRRRVERRSRSFARKANLVYFVSQPSDVGAARSRGQCRREGIRGPAESCFRIRRGDPDCHTCGGSDGFGLAGGRYRRCQPARIDALFNGAEDGKVVSAVYKRVDSNLVWITGQQKKVTKLPSPTTAEHVVDELVSERVPVDVDEERRAVPRGWFVVGGLGVLTAVLLVVVPAALVISLLLRRDVAINDRVLWSVLVAVLGPVGALAYLATMPFGAPLDRTFRVAAAIMSGTLLIGWFAMWPLPETVLEQSSQAPR